MHLKKTTLKNIDSTAKTDHVNVYKEYTFKHIKVNIHEYH